MSLDTFIKCCLLNYGKRGIGRFKVMIIRHELDEHGTISDEPLSHPCNFQVYEVTINKDEKGKYLLIKVMYFEDEFYEDEDEA